MSDHYVKKFDTSDHLISMLFSTFANCTSLLEVASSMLGFKGKMSHFRLKTIGKAIKKASHHGKLFYFVTSTGESSNFLEDVKLILQ